MIKCILFIINSVCVKATLWNLFGIHSQIEKRDSPQIDNVVTIILRHNPHSQTNHIKRT